MCEKMKSTVGSSSLLASDDDDCSIEQQLSMLPLNPTWDDVNARLPKPGDHFAGQAIASQRYGLTDLQAVAHELKLRDERIRSLTDAHEASKSELQAATRERNLQYVRAERYKSMVSAQAVWIYKEWGLHSNWTAGDAHVEMKRYVMETTTHDLNANAILQSMVTKFGIPAQSGVPPVAS